MHRGPESGVQGNTFGWNSKLRKADDFSSVFRFKRVLRGTSLDILFRQNGLEYPRLGLIVPKKILAKAVDRNRVKRVLREGFRLNQHDLGGLDVVIRVKAAGRDIDYRAQWATFLQRFTPHPQASTQQMNG